MDKIKELLEDQNNKIIAIAIGVVLILGIVVLVGFITKNNQDNPPATTDGMNAGMPGMGPDGMPGSMPGMPGNTPGMPGDMPGMGPGGMPGMSPDGMVPGGMPGSSELNAETAGDTGEVKTASSGKPIEEGRIDPFAPIGVAKASQTKTFGDKIKGDLYAKGVDFRIPGLLEAISFTDYTPSTKIGYMKTDADIARDKKKKAQEKKDRDQKYIDIYKNIIYAKPANIRLSSILKGKNTIASFEVILGGRSEFEALKVGESLTYGYNYEGKPIKAKVKSIGENSAVLEALDVDNVDWKFNVSDGTSRYMNGMGDTMGMPGMPGMPGQMGGMPGMPGAMGGMPGQMDDMFGMPGSMGGMNPGMGGMPGAMGGMNPGMGGMNAIF